MYNLFLIEGKLFFFLLNIKITFNLKVHSGVLDGNLKDVSVCCVVEENVKLSENVGHHLVRKSNSRDH